MSDSFITEQYILEDIQENIDQTYDELITIAHEDSSEGAREFLELTGDDSNIPLVHSYISEVLKAFGCCAFNIPTDDEDSRQTLRRLDDQKPQLSWIRDIYQKAVDLDEVNDDLKDDPQALVLAQERLVSWLT